MSAEDESAHFPVERARVEHARVADGDALTAILHDPNEDVIRAALENPHLQERQVCILLDRADLPAAILELVAAMRDFLSSEKVKLRLARHPQTPRQIALRLVRQLYLFDLVELSLLPFAPAEVRRVAEEVIVAKIAQLPLGQKIALARRSPSRVAGALIAEGHPQVTKIALENAALSESQILKVLSNQNTHERVVIAIAQHAKWSGRRDVRMALLRNPRAPYPVLLSFLPELAPGDLREIAALDTISPQLRKHIETQLSSRGSE